jgi:uncharacterized RDD family membrane protein YckC
VTERTQPSGPCPDFPPGATRADYGPRLGGWLIDFVCVSLVWLLVVVPSHLIHEAPVLVRGTHIWRYDVGPVAVLIDAVIAVLYGGLLCGLPRGQTIGMTVAGIRAVDAEDGAPLGCPRALVRAAAEYVMAVVFFLPWVLDVAFPLWDPQRQTVHDKIARTVVVTV